MKTPKFPKKIWLEWEETNDEDGGFWLAHEERDEAATLGESVKVGAYDLGSIETLTTKIEVK